MKLSLPCQHQGLFPTVIMVGPRFEQRQISVCNGLPHQLFPITAQRPFAHDFELRHHYIFFFLIGNQKYPPHLWLILDLANGYLMAGGWRSWACNSWEICSIQSMKSTPSSKELQSVSSTTSRPAASSTCTQCNTRMHILHAIFLTLVFHCSC